ncbi:hypothetical protein N7517_006310 [Penicillium concentricum]|uniref:DUF3533 domain-containing protein n=1 Tax=Penicillium concentricum TaxID=293559 RepID=A0A9W9VB77_9EURO|nr:uncharacterized protein N7517_006310 [Penicillium concentricum]KAJ5374304.1 hypothetical protein N7517_006310 [Penicillium concentricum]
MLRDSKGPGIRYSGDSEFWKGKKRRLGLIILMILVVLQMAFLGNVSWILGSLFGSEERVKNVKLVLVDYDQGFIGEAVQTAYSKLKGDTFPTIQVADETIYPSPADTVDEVCRNIDIYGAIYIHKNASTRLQEALSGTSNEPYNSSDTLTYVVNEARYSLAVAQAVVTQGTSILAQATNAVLAQAMISQGFNASSESALQAFFNPITPTSKIIGSLPQTARALYNTAIIVLVILPNVFFIMAMNQIQTSWKMLSRATIRANVGFRVLTSLVYALVTASCASGYILAFKENWDATASQGVLTWLAFGLYCHINFLVIDISTAFVPMPGVPFIVLWWIIANVTSTVYPFELNPGFYKIGYALPAHHHYANLVTIWSNGCAPQLHRTLPVLFSWWIVGMGVGIYGMVKRCEDAARAEHDDLAKSGQIELSEFNDTQNLFPQQATSTAYGLPVPVQDTLHLRQTQSSQLGSAT